MERQPIEVFFSYSREDKPLRDKLEIHLSSLRQQGVISSWHDRQIVAGSEWEEEIDHHMRTADIILLLVSPDFVNSKYCYDIELPYAMRRHEAGEAYVVPILMRPVARWKNLPFAKLQVYPSGGVPITQWADPDNGFVDVAEGIAIAVEKLLEERQEQERLNLEKIQQERDAWEVEEFSNQGLEKQNKGNYQSAIADMTSGLLHLAQQGDAQAIADLMNQTLRPRGMTATVERTGGTLSVVLESEQIPNRLTLTAFVYRGISNLEVKSIRSITVKGQQTGSNLPVWTEDMTLEVKNL
jgi:TIR domain